MSDAERESLREDAVALHRAADALRRRSRKAWIVDVMIRSLEKAAASMRNRADTQESDR
jgi:hypothetical protein